MIFEINLKSMTPEALMSELMEKVRRVERKNEHWYSREVDILKEEILRRLQEK